MSLTHEPRPAGLETKVEFDRDVFSRREVLRVLYRRPPTRRWTRVLVVPEEGQDTFDFLPHVAAIAATHEAAVAARGVAADGDRQ